MRWSQGRFLCAEHTQDGNATRMTLLLETNICLSSVVLIQYQCSILGEGRFNDPMNYLTSVLYSLPACSSLSLSLSPRYLTKLISLPVRHC